MHFSAFGWEIHSETTATRKVTVKPLRYIPLQEQFDNLSIIDIFACKWKTQSQSFRMEQCMKKRLLSEKHIPACPLILTWLLAR